MMLKSENGKNLVIGYIRAVKYLKSYKLNYEKK